MKPEEKRQNDIVEERYGNIYWIEQNLLKYCEEDNDEYNTTFQSLVIFIHKLFEYKMLDLVDFNIKNLWFGTGENEKEHWFVLCIEKDKIKFKNKKHQKIFFDNMFDFLYLKNIKKNCHIQISGICNDDTHFRIYVNFINKL